MKDFLKDYWFYLVLFILLFYAIFEFSHYINNQNKERLAIINNTKDNVFKYSNCEYIDNFYYCWNENKFKDKMEEYNE